MCIIIDYSIIINKPILYLIIILITKNYYSRWKFEIQYLPKHSLLL